MNEDKILKKILNMKLNGKLWETRWEPWVAEDITQKEGLKWEETVEVLRDDRDRQRGLAARQQTEWKC